ncbi:MAG: response regulator, partial [Verrucomicrobia bacterium]|nr:response regulator [Verrucomicrobiota bacterium]
AAFVFMILLRLCLAFRPEGLAPVAAAAYARLALLALVSSIFLLGGLIQIDRLYAERKAVEATLNDSRQRFQQLAEQLQDVVWMTDPAGDRLMFINPAYERVWGRTCQSAYATRPPFTEAIHPEDRENVRGELAGRQKGSFEEIEYRILRPDGGVRWIRDRAFPVRRGTGEVYCIAGIAEDVTERKRIEDQRVALERKLLEAQKLESLGVLAGGIAHDFNNLLTAILGNVSLAVMETPSESPAQGCLKNIEQVSLQAAGLCRQMLAYSGRGRTATRRLDLTAVIQDMNQLLQVSIAKTNVLKFELGEDLPAVEVDVAQLRQVILNLVINASEAIGERSGVIRIRTGVLRATRAWFAEAHLSPDLPSGDYVYLEVVDTGCGMTAATRGRIFDPFFTTKFTGRGLGLAAVLGIVRAHRGAVKVVSESGRGSTFTLLLPCAGGASEVDQPAPPAADGAWRGSGTILVVDDEDTVRTVTARMLESLGFEVLLAADGREGVNTFSTHASATTLVLLDMTMPHLDGEATLREIRRIRPDARVILTSGYSEQDASSRFTGLDLSGFLQKPFRLEELREKMREVLTRSG